MFSTVQLLLCNNQIKVNLKHFFKNCLFICENVLIFLLTTMIEYFGQRNDERLTIASMYCLNEYNAGFSPLHRQEGLL